MIDRRAFLTATGARLLTAPVAAEAQQPAKVPRIGYPGSPEVPETRALLEAFRQGLRERGYAEGQNIVPEYHPADRRVERFPALAAELAGPKVDLIVAPNIPGPELDPRRLALLKETLPKVTRVGGL